MAAICFLVLLLVGTEAELGICDNTLLKKSLAPYAVVKLGPDLQQSPFKDAYSGYLTAGNVTGFSMMHESGTGGAPKYGVVSQFPIASSVDNPLANISTPRAVNDTAGVGYYKTELVSNITVELAASYHAALYQYTFPDEEEHNVVVDVSHVLISEDRPQWTQNYVNGSFEVFTDGHYEGYGIYNGGWNLGTSEWQRVYRVHLLTGPTLQLQTGRSIFAASLTRQFRTRQRSSGVGQLQRHSDPGLLPSQAAKDLVRYSPSSRPK